MIEKRKLIADIDIDELIDHDLVVNYSQNDQEDAYNEAIAIFERDSARVGGEYRIIEVKDTGLDVYLLLLVHPNFDMKEEILGPDENNIDDQFNELHQDSEYWERVKKGEKE